MQSEPHTAGRMIRRIARFFGGYRFEALAIVIGLLAYVAPTQPVMAHELRPTVVTATVPQDGQIRFDIRINLEALIAGISPEHKDTDESVNSGAYKELRAMSPEELSTRFNAFSSGWLDRITVKADGLAVELGIEDAQIPDVGDTAVSRTSRIVLNGQLPPKAETFTWTYPGAFGSSVLRAMDENGQLVSIGWFRNGEQSPPVAVYGAESQSTLDMFLSYVVIGFEHIVPKGLDHILFVLGLYLLSPALRPLLYQVTAFTVAHSITLALALYGVVQLPGSIVEPLIALSIVYVAVENLATSRLSPWRPAIVFVFGLLHGLGFAGVLQEVGLPRDDYAIGLVAFNIGVEGGQLAVIAAAWLCTGLWFAAHPWYRSRIVWPGSVCIAAIGLYWTVERVVGA